MTDDLGLFFFAMFLLFCLWLSVTGIIYMSMDYRHFNSVKEQCIKQGFIQDNRTRILCKVEVQQ